MLLSLSLLAALPAPARAAEPDQVLVLYNADWTEDRPGTLAGQDSEEVASYYALRHTDAHTGRKPHMLGLSCKHKKDGKPCLHLSGDNLDEDSSDNGYGVVYRGAGTPLSAEEHKRQGWFLLSHLVELRLPLQDLDPRSLCLKVGRTDEESKAVLLYNLGQSAKLDAARATPMEGGGRIYRTSGPRLGIATGPMYVWVGAKDRQGRVLWDQRLEYPDYSRLTIALKGELALETLQMNMWEDADPTQFRPVVRDGNPAIPFVTIEKDAAGATLVLDALRAGWRGEFGLNWAVQKRTASGSLAPGIADTRRVRDWRDIQIAIPDAESRVDWNTVSIRYSAQDDAASSRPLVEGGQCQVKTDVVTARDEREPGGGRTWRVLSADARQAGFKGDAWAWLSARDTAEQPFANERVRLFDLDDFGLSPTGPDNVRDDRNYLEDVEAPVKAFLEDPARRVDGQLLKDRVLYVVVCWGLPQTVRRTYGVAQSATPSPRDFGTLVALTQRLETMYLDLGKVRLPAVEALRLDERIGSFQMTVPISSLWRPLAGAGEQPWMHPSAYQNWEAQPRLAPPWPLPPRFTTAERAKSPERFLYVAARIDGPEPLLAKGLVDQAEYAARHLTARMGGKRAEDERDDWDGPALLAKTAGLAGLAELRALGLLGCGEGSGYAAWVGRRSGGGYFPGGIDWQVVAGNGCRDENSPVCVQLRGHATATAGVARVLGGCPHTTSHAWWDARVFYHYLFRGYDLGEAWLLSRYTLLWATSFYGDPLFAPDLARTRIDRQPPRLAAARDIAIEVLPAAGGFEVQLEAAIASTPDQPELAMAAAEYWPAGDDPKAPRDEAQVCRAADPTYRRRPAVVLHGLRPETTYAYRLFLTDPYENIFDSQAAFGVLTFKTGAASELKAASRPATTPASRSAGALPPP